MAHVLTPEEQAVELANRRAHPFVLISGWRCHCGDEYPFDPIWQGIGDQLTVTCRKGHTSIIRYLPETVSR